VNDDFETVKVKLVTIIASFELGERIAADLRELGVGGYTRTKVNGWGRHGVREFGLIGGANVRLDSLVAPELAREILRSMAANFADSPLIALRRTSRPRKNHRLGQTSPSENRDRLRARDTGARARALARSRGTARAQSLRRGRNRCIAAPSSSVRVHPLHNRRIRQQIREQVAVVHHGLAQIFGVDLAAAARISECARGAVVLHHGRVLDGQVSDALIEMFRRVAAGAHHLVDELVGAGHGHGRIVDELRLNARPGRREARAIRRLQLLEPKVLHAPRARRKLPLRARRTAELGQPRDRTRGQNARAILRSATRARRRAITLPMITSATAPIAAMIQTMVVLFMAFASKFLCCRLRSNARAQRNRSFAAACMS